MVVKNKNWFNGKRECYFDIDVIGEIFEFVRSRQAAEFPVVVVRRETVVSASLDVDGS